MADNSEANIATADALTLLLHNQHAIAAAIEEVALLARTSGSPEAHSNAIAALETLDGSICRCRSLDESHRLLRRRPDRTFVATL